MEHVEMSIDKQINGDVKNHINKVKRHQKLINLQTHKIQKRPPAKPFSTKNDIFLSNKSNFKAILKKCGEVIRSDSGEVSIHALGNAIPRAINLALTLVEESGNGYAYEAATSSKQLIDDLHPLNDDEDFEMIKRMNSCLQLRIYRRSNIIPKTL